MKKYIAGIDMCSDRIRKISKCNATIVYPAYFENENWNHVAACCKNEENREECEKYLGKKIKRMQQ